MRVSAGLARLRVPLSRTSAAVLVLLGGIAVVIWLVMTSVLQGQERRGLRNRTNEIASVISDGVTNTQSTLRLLAGVPERTGNSAAEFAGAADPLLTAGVKTVGVVSEHAGRPVVIASAGNGPTAGESLTGERALVVRRALASGRLTVELIHSPSGVRLSVAVPGPQRTVGYEESAINPRQPVPAPPGSPFSELDIVIYAAPYPSRAELVATNVRGSSPADGFDHTLVAVGTSRWLLLTRSRQPLVGTFAASMPWVVLGIALFTALLVTTLVELLARRRRYALNLVAQRTTELRQALDQQVTLERDQRAARHAADKANLAKSEFLSRMSHELRTPLNAVIGFGQLLELDELEDRSREHVGHILKGGRHLLELINEVLELSRIEAGELQISPEAVPLAETVREAVSLVRPIAANHDVHLVSDTSALADDGHVDADRQRLKQVLLNLLSNAIKYNRPGGDVKVSFARAGDDRIRVLVADTGIGISADQFSRVFEPFERLGAERSDVQGTGLGLALSERLVQAMGGSITLESELGRGSTFTVELAAAEPPRGPADPSVNGDALRELIRPPGGNSYRILYIEDNLSNLTLIERILDHQPGIELIPAMQGMLGLELAREHRPDLILLDLHLPDLPGEQVLRRLKAEPATSTIPVIVLSADAGKRQAKSLITLGAANYLTKPLNVPEFIDALSAQLGAAGSSIGASGALQSGSVDY